MSSEHHNAVRWNGRMIEGGAPTWIVIAVRKGPLSPGGLCRVHDTVHVFDNRTGKQVVGIAKPGDWILMLRKNGDLLVQTHDEMCKGWTHDGVGYVRRSSEIKPRAGTEYELEVGLQLQAGWLQIRPTNFPRLHETMEKISHDRGSGAGHELYAVPQDYAPMLDAMEKGLATLSASDRETFAIGEQSEAERMIRTHPGLRWSHQMLNKFHEGWQE